MITRARSAAAYSRLRLEPLSGDPQPLPLSPLQKTEEQSEKEKNENASLVRYNHYLFCLHLFLCVSAWFCFFSIQTSGRLFWVVGSRKLQPFTLYLSRTAWVIAPHRMARNSESFQASNASLWRAWREQQGSHLLRDTGLLRLLDATTTTTVSGDDEAYATARLQAASELLIWGSNGASGAVFPYHESFDLWPGFLFFLDGLYSAVTTAHHFWAWKWRDVYTDQVKSGVRAYRWIEYALTASTMLFALCVISTTKDVFVCGLSALAMGVLQVCGYFAEQALAVIEDKNEVDFKRFAAVRFAAWLWFGMILFVAAWFPVWYEVFAHESYKLLTSSDRDQEILENRVMPAFVYCLLALETYLFALFPAALLRRALSCSCSQTKSRFVNFLTRLFDGLLYWASVCAAVVLTAGLCVLYIAFASNQSGSDNSRLNLYKWPARICIGGTIFYFFLLLIALVLACVRLCRCAAQTAEQTQDDEAATTAATTTEARLRSERQFLGLSASSKTTLTLLIVALSAWASTVGDGGGDDGNSDNNGNGGDDGSSNVWLYLRGVAFLFRSSSSF